MAFVLDIDFESRYRRGKSLKTDALVIIGAMLLSGPVRPRLPSSSSIPIRPRGSGRFL